MQERTAARKSGAQRARVQRSAQLKAPDGSREADTSGNVTPVTPFWTCKHESRPRLEKRTRKRTSERSWNKSSSKTVE